MFGFFKKRPANLMDQIIKAITEFGICAQSIAARPLSEFFTHVFTETSQLVKRQLTPSGIAYRHWSSSAPPRCQSSRSILALASWLRINLAGTPTAVAPAGTS